jgi:hypothetical protein
VLATPPMVSERARERRWQREREAATMTVIV